MMGTPDPSFMESGKIEFSDQTSEALDQAVLDDPNQEVARLKILSALNKVSKEKRRSKGRATKLEEAGELF